MKIMRLPDETLENAINVYKTAVEACKNVEEEDYCPALDIVTIRLLEELQQYRGIGTVEDLKTMKENGAFTGIELAQIAVNQMELKKYQEIGTVEQCREAVERMKQKLVIKHKNPMEGCPDLNVCPNCKRIMVRTEIFGRTIDEHCVCCGQAIDWEE